MQFFSSDISCVRTAQGIGMFVGAVIYFGFLGFVLKMLVYSQMGDLFF